jgi:hypothetical protein
MTQLRNVVIAIVVGAGCSSPRGGSLPDDARPADTAIDTSSTDAPISHIGLAPTMFSINWPTRDVMTPPSNNPWPTVAEGEYGSLRTWGSVVDWANIEKTRCNPLDHCWDWTQLDAMIARSRQLGVDQLHFVTADYPGWSNGNLGSGVLPNDIASGGACSNIPASFRVAAGLVDGDCQFQEFVFALAMHACPTCNTATGPWQGMLAIRSFSPGNEVNGKEYVDPPCSSTATTPCDMVARMASDLHRIIKYVDPTTVVGTPSFTQVGGDAAMRNYLERARGYGDIADVMIFHIYGQAGSVVAGMPEATWGTRIARYAELRTAANYMLDKPMWVDEGGWGQNFQTNDMGQLCKNDTNCGCITSPVSACMDANNADHNETITGVVTAPAPGYLVRGYLQMIASGVDRFYWYGPGSDEWGSLADCVGDTTACTNQRTAGGFAWHSMYQWLVGVEATAHTTIGTQYSVAITGKDPARAIGCATTLAPAGYHATIAWDTTATPALDCGGYTHYCTLFETTASGLSPGTAHPCVGSVNLGPNPILLE